MPEGPSASRSAATGSQVPGGVALAAEETMDAVLGTVLDRAREAIGARFAALGLLDQGGRRIERFITLGIDDGGPAHAAPRARQHGVMGVLGVLMRTPGTLRAAGPADHPDLSGVLGTAIALGDRVFGHLYLADKLTGEFTDADAQLLEAMATQAAATIAVTRRLELERLRVTGLSRVPDTLRLMQRVLTRALSEDVGLEALLPEVARRVRRLVDADAAYVGLVEGSAVVVHATAPARARLAVGESVGSDMRGFTTALRARGAGAVLAVPLRLGGSLTGVLAATGSTVDPTVARALMSAVGSQLALALANERAARAEREGAAAQASHRAAEEGFRRAVWAQETERARIARELHDEAGQVLTAMVLHLRALRDDEADAAKRARLDELRLEVADAAVHLHELISDLRPAALRDHGFAAAVSQQASRVSAATGIDVEVQLRVALADITEEVQIAMFRVVQEALTNVARHSGARHAWVEATRTPDRLRLQVRDDGVGFDPAAVTERHGLAGMRERVALLGGELHVRSATDAGTCVELRLDPRAHTA
ncbi:MAG: GAF domain-containing sensor histidine kinase [Thermoleophilia bacterium]